MVVPELATNRSAKGEGMSEAPPGKTVTNGSGVAHPASTAKPSCRSASIMTSVSSLRNQSKTLTSRERQHRAARTRARLVMLLEPGTRTVARGGRSSGRMGSFSGSGPADMGLPVVGDAHEEQPLRRGGGPGAGPVPRLEDRLDLRLRPVAPPDVEQGAGDRPHHIVQEAVRLHIEPDPVAHAIERQAGDGADAGG